LKVLNFQQLLHHLIDSRLEGLLREARLDVLPPFVTQLPPQLLIPVQFHYCAPLFPQDLPMGFLVSPWVLSVPLVTGFSAI